MWSAWERRAPACFPPTSWMGSRLRPWQRCGCVPHGAAGVVAAVGSGLGGGGARLDLGMGGHRCVLAAGGARLDLGMGGHRCALAAGGARLDLGMGGHRCALAAGGARLDLGMGGHRCVLAAGGAVFLAPYNPRGQNTRARSSQRFALGHGGFQTQRPLLTARARLSLHHTPLARTHAPWAHCYTLTWLALGSLLVQRRPPQLGTLQEATPVKSEASAQGAAAARSEAGAAAAPGEAGAPAPQVAAATEEAACTEALITHGSVM